MSRYNPSLLIMAKQLGESYLKSTQILAVDGGKATAAALDADEDADAVAAGGSPAPKEQELLRLLDELLPVKKPRKDLKESQKPFAYEEAGYENLESVWSHCSEQDIADYKDWYFQANQDCQNLVAELSAEIAKLGPPDPLRMVIGIVAATSQGTLWEENLELARQVIKSQDLKQFKVKGPKKAQEPEDDEAESSYRALAAALKITPDNLKKVQSIFSGDFTVLESDKYGAFFESIIDPVKTASTVVVDTHATCIWLGQRLGVKDPFFMKNRPDGARLAAIVRDYRALATKVGLTAQSIQAVTWCVWRKMPPRFTTETLKHDEVNPEVDMFKALYPFLYAKVKEGTTKPSWRWYYNKVGDAMQPKGMPDEEWQQAQEMFDYLKPHNTPEQFRKIVQTYGKELDRYYAFPPDAWQAFLKAYPNFGQGLEQAKNKRLAAMFEAAAHRLWRP